MASSIFGLLNNFVPFADPTRPLWRDITLSTVLCIVLYVAPQVNLVALKNKFLADKERATNLPPAIRLHGEQQENAPEAEDTDEALLNNDAVDHREHLRRQVNDGQNPRIIQEQAAEEPRAADVNPHQPRPRDPNREVGAKKAKSIARRNQQRAYNEWLREQGDAQRAEWALDEQEREDELAVERQRRTAVKNRLREKDRSEREARRAKEEAGRQNELEASKAAVRMVEERLKEKKFSSVDDIARTVKRTNEWVRKLVKREGLLGFKSVKGERTLIILTKSGWIVQISNREMDNAYRQMISSCKCGEGKVTWDAIGRIVQQHVTAR